MDLAKRDKVRKPSSIRRIERGKIRLRLLLSREILCPMHADSLPNLIGTWRLVSYKAQTPSGEIRYPLGEHVIGQLFYDLHGNMSAHVMRTDRPPFGSDDSAAGTDAEVRTAFEGHTSYFGTCRIDPAAGTVTHHADGASYPNWMGHDQLRYYRIEGSHLVLSTPPILFRGESLEYVLTWQRT
jgi:hypothetical protein